MPIETIYTDLEGNPRNASSGLEESDRDILLKRLSQKLRDDHRAEKWKRRKHDSSIKVKKLEL